MQRMLIVVLTMLLVLSVCLCGCQDPAVETKPSQSEPPADSTSQIVVGGLLHMIRIDGQLYQPGTQLPASVRVSQEQMIGHTVSYVPGEVPAEDGACNFLEKGTAYAYLDTEAYPDTYVFLYADTWCTLVPVDTE